MLYDIEGILLCMEKNEINLKQFFLCLLLSQDSDLKNELVSKWSKIESISDKEIQDLLDRQFIDDFRISKNQYAADNFLVRPDKFKELFTPPDAYEQLFDLYPDFVLIEGKGRYPSKAIGIRENNECRKLYMAYVGSVGKKKHDVVMEKTDKIISIWGGFAPMKFESYIVGKHWQSLDNMEGGNVTNNIREV